MDCFKSLFHLFLYMIIDHHVTDLSQELSQWSQCDCGSCQILHCFQSHQWFLFLQSQLFWETTIYSRIAHLKLKVSFCFWQHPYYSAQMTISGYQPGNFQTNSDSMNITEENDRKSGIFAVTVCPLRNTCELFKVTHFVTPTSPANLISIPSIGFWKRRKSWDKTSHKSTLKSP